MAKGKKVEKEKKGGPVKAEALTEDQLQALFFAHKRSYEKMLAAKKKADADFKNACKLAKSEIGDDATARIKVAIQLEEEGGEEAVRAKIQATLQVARWVGAKIGTQFEFFDERDRTPSVDRAYANGKRAGLAGEVCKPPHSPGVPQYDSWLKGHADGNAALATAGFKAPPPPIGTTEPTHRVMN